MGQTSEAIVVSETHEMYVWVLRMQVEIEPMRKLSSVRLIFGDGMITRGLLTALGIERTCVLHGDYYHLLYEVWPLEKNFGQVLFLKIKQELVLMLNSLTRDHWNNAYNSAKNILINHPDKLELLDEIYNDPQYYSGYYLKTIRRNMNLRGNVGAEQNHSSLHAFLGGNMSSSVTFEVRGLLERDQQHYKEIRQNEVSVHLSSHNYDSDFIGQKGIEDREAKKVLSKFAYNELWLKSLKSSCYLQLKSDLVEQVNYIWPRTEQRSTVNQVIIPFLKRCICFKRIAFDHQCEHELCLDHSFKVSSYDDVWYNCWYWNGINPVFTSNLMNGKNELEKKTKPFVTNSPPFFPMESLKVPESTMTIDDDQFEDNESVGLNHFSGIDNDSDDISQKRNNISFNDMAHVFSEIARAVQHDPTERKRVLATSKLWLSNIRSNHDYNIHVVSEGSLMSTKKNGESEFAQSALITPVHWRKRKGRYKSAAELSRKKPHVKRSSLSGFGYSPYNSPPTENLFQTEGTALNPHIMSDSIPHESIMIAMRRDNDSDFTAPKTRKTGRSCQFCGSKGHGQFKCIKLLEYGSYPLIDGDVPARQQLSANLISFTSFDLYERVSHDQRVVLMSLPKKVHALVIHKKYFKSPDPTLRTNVQNICIECTLLNKPGVPHSEYVKSLFAALCVSAFVTKTKSNLIVSMV